MLRVEEQFAHYIIGQSIESFRVGGAKEFLNQMFMILGGALHPGNHEEEAEDCGQSGLVQWPTLWQRHGEHHGEQPP